MVVQREAGVRGERTISEKHRAGRRQKRREGEGHGETRPERGLSRVQLSDSNSSNSAHVAVSPQGNTRAENNGTNDALEAPSLHTVVGLLKRLSSATHGPSFTGSSLHLCPADQIESLNGAGERASYSHM